MSQTRVVIKPDNTIDEPAPLACAPGDAITFVVENRHRDDQNVWIDPDRIVHKHDGRKKNPLAHGKKSARVAAADSRRPSSRGRPGPSATRASARDARPPSGGTMGRAARR